jgi:hypothetical protein
VEELIAHVPHPWGCALPLPAAMAGMKARHRFSPHFNSPYDYYELTNSLRKEKAV